MRITGKNSHSVNAYKWISAGCKCNAVVSPSLRQKFNKFDQTLSLYYDLTKYLHSLLSLICWLSVFTRMCFQPYCVCSRSTGAKHIWTVKYFFRKEKSALVKFLLCDYNDGTWCLQPFSISPSPRSYSASSVLGFELLQSRVKSKPGDWLD